MWALGSAGTERGIGPQPSEIQAGIWHMLQAGFKSYRNGSTWILQEIVCSLLIAEGWNEMIFGPFQPKPFRIGSMTDHTFISLGKASYFFPSIYLFHVFPLILYGNPQRNKGK